MIALIREVENWDQLINLFFIYFFQLINHSSNYLSVSFKAHLLTFCTGHTQLKIYIYIYTALPQKNLELEGESDMYIAKEEELLQVYYGSIYWYREAQRREHSTQKV